MTARTGDALDIARAALLESAPEHHVGAFLTSALDDVDGARITTHTFECTNPAYPGWYWAVATVQVPGSDEFTVSEVNLLPGSEALVPPHWQPWSTRVQPGDLGVGDLLPTEPGDPRLAPGFTDTDAAEDLAPLAPVAWELGLGRESVLSPLGLELAVDRWMSGQTGPRAAMAKAAPSQCSTCGFLAPIGGSVGQAFGVCANAYGAADGQIVALDFGCGAHSSVRIDHSRPVPVVGLAVDDDADEVSGAEDLPEYEDEPASEEDRAGGDNGDDDPDGAVGHESDLIDHLDEDSLVADLDQQRADAGIDVDTDGSDEDDQVDWTPSPDER